MPAAYVPPGERAAADLSATDKRLTWANWPLYIDTDDEDETRRPTSAAFEIRGVSEPARHKANAERLIDYYYEPQVAAELAAWVNYVCPVPAAQDVLASAKDEETAALAEDPLIFPDKAMRGSLAIARDIPPGERVEFAKRWNGIAGL